MTMRNVGLKGQLVMAVFVRRMGVAEIQPEMRSDTFLDFFV